MQVRYAEETYRDVESGEDNALLVTQPDDRSSDDDANFEVGTFERPVESSFTPVYRLALGVCGFLALLFSIVYFAEDTNGDAYIVNELVEYIIASAVVSWGWVTWTVGLGLNAIPNIPESLLLFSLTMIKFKPFYLRHQHNSAIAHSSHTHELEETSEHEHDHGHEHDHEHGHDHEGHSPKRELQGDADFDQEDDAFEQQVHRHNRRFGAGAEPGNYSLDLDLLESQLNHKPLEQQPQQLTVHESADHITEIPRDHAKHGHHHGHDHQHTTFELIREIFLMGITPGALGFSASYFVLGRLPLWARIVISVFLGGVGGAADWIKHSHFNHAAGDVDTQNPLVRTFSTNLWRTNQPFLWKIHETWVKVIIMIHHGGAGLFNWYSVLSVTTLADLMPWWVSLVIALVLALPSFYYEGVSETYAYDQARLRQGFEIHRISRGGLIAGGIIHSLSFVVVVARLYQANPERNGTFYYLINSAIVAVLSVLLLYPGAKGFFVMQKYPPVDHDGVDGLCFDDVVRLLVKAPRPDRQRVQLELKSQMRFWRDPTLANRVSIVQDDEFEVKVEPSEEARKTTDETDLTFDDRPGALALEY